MTVYAVTGELGTGKTLVCVQRIRDALVAGKRVVSNLDLRLENLVSDKRPRDVLRLPDFPTREDLDAIGYGYDPALPYDESRFGCLVIDEAATFLNARDYRADGRDDVIKWLLHARKFRWDVYLIIQNLTMLDKQARTAFVEHLVRCRRGDRLPIPFLGFWVSLLGLGRVHFPKIHYAIVRYGTGPYAMIVDKWIYTGRGLYGAYDTAQKLVGRVIAWGGKEDPKTGRFPVEVLERSLCCVLDPYRAKWLRKPRGLRWRAYNALCALVDRGGWVGRLASILRPSLTAEERGRIEFELVEAGVAIHAPIPAVPTFAEWVMARATARPEGGPGPSGLGGEGEAAPEVGYLAQEAA